MFKPKKRIIEGIAEVDIVRGFEAAHVPISQNQKKQNLDPFPTAKPKKAGSLTHFTSDNLYSKLFFFPPLITYYLEFVVKMLYT